MQQLRCVVAVARTGNLSRAAEQCHVSQPSLSQQIKKLEDELGERLFDRMKREAKVTAYGQAFLRRAVRILEGVDERFIGFLIEHYAGNFPLWLAPDQVRFITLNDDEALINHAKSIVAELRASRVRVDSDFSATPKAVSMADILAGLRERRA